MTREPNILILPYEVMYRIPCQRVVDVFQRRNDVISGLVLGRMNLESSEQSRSSNPYACICEISPGANPEESQSFQRENWVTMELKTDLRPYPKLQSGKGSP